MKRNILYTLLLFVGLSAQAQITLNADWFLEVGDTMEIATDNMPEGIDLIGNGGPHAWDFTQLEAPNSTTLVYEDASTGDDFEDFPNAELLVNLPTAGIGYIDVADEQMTLLGYAGADPIGLGLDFSTVFSPGLMERKAPLNFIDSYESSGSILLPFAFSDLPSALTDSLDLPFTPDSIRIKIDVTRDDIVDAYGTCQIPAGTFDVLRIKRVETNETKIEILLFAGLPWQDVTALLGDLIGELGNFEQTSYRFVSDQATEEIAVVNVDADEEVTSVDFKAGFISSLAPSILEQPNMFAYPNPAYLDLRVDFINLPSDVYTFEVYNIIGVKMHTQKERINGSKTIKFSVDDFRKGTYLYSLVNSKGKVVKTKRLIVIKP